MATATLAQDLPAINTVTTNTFVCTIESKNDAGMTGFQCKNKNTGSTQGTAFINIAEGPSMFGNGEMTCMYWKKDAKNHIQCGDASKILLEGDVPAVAKSLPWFLLWL
jgi:hypothetical protein